MEGGRKGKREESNKEEVRRKEGGGGRGNEKGGKQNWERKEGYRWRSERRLRKGGRREGIRRIRIREGEIEGRGREKGEGLREKGGGEGEKGGGGRE